MWKRAFMTPANIDVKSSLVFLPHGRYKNRKKDNSNIKSWLVSAIQCVSMHVVSVVRVAL